MIIIRVEHVHAHAGCPVNGQTEDLEATMLSDTCFAMPQIRCRYSPSYELPIVAILDVR